MSNIEELIAAREEAMMKVRFWWLDRAFEEPEPMSERTQSQPSRDELAAAFAKKFPAVLAQYSQFKIVDWFLSVQPSPQEKP